ncbi:hypothetical protein [Streptomyces sp. TR06-5]|uniref:hypothetical protein n=1 Tax=unclassified Streptomyces TaxID=2593676 RepID=UPI0039A3BEEC
MLEEHVNATLDRPIEEQPAEYLGEQQPVMTAVAAFAAGAAVVAGAYAAGKAVG